MIRISQIDDKFSIYKENTVVLLGVGHGTKQILDLFKYHKINIDYICDNNKENFGKVLEGIPVVSPQHLQQIVQSENNQISGGGGEIVVQIAMNNINNSIEQQLKSIDIHNIISFNEAYNVLGFFRRSDLIKNAPHIIESYNKFITETRVNSEQVKIYDYIGSNYHKQSFIFLCMRGKTGDATLLNTFAKHQIQSHFVYHSPQLLDIDMLKKSDRKIKIITAIRDPLAFRLSAFYQDISTLCDPNIVWPLKHIETDEHLLKNGGDLQDIFDNIITKNSIENPMSVFFDLFKKYVIDLSLYPFDKDLGYTIVKDGNIEIFVYQLEKMNNCVTEMSNWIGENNFNEWVMGNVTNDRWTSKSYKQAQKEIKFPIECYNNSYNDPWMQHFYSREDIEKFKDKWKNNIKE